ncbi:MAG: hypothetical protein H6838_07015 [Planctomycetes bacterium]|nr:hypothetical protein [Planctomycetota bacterium]
MTHYHRSTISSLLLLSLACAPDLLAQGGVLVSPGDRLNLEGSSYTSFPLGRASCRMQTLHADVPGNAVITGHGYRRDAIGVRGRIDGLAVEVQVTASVTSTLPANASPTFAQNRGPNPVVVLPRTWVVLPPTDRPALDPAPSFELLIPWAVPFVTPAQGGTLCLEVEVFANQTATASNQNVSLYLDAHENYLDGRAEQPGFRLAQGCAAPGSNRDSNASLVLWHRGAQMDLDVAVRDGVPDPGSGLVRAFVALGTQLVGQPWPTAPACTVYSSAELLLAMPGAVTATGSYDGSFAGLPVLPPGFRLWCQAGTIDLGTGALAFSDASALMTPPAGPLPVPTSRVVNSTNVAGTTGTVSLAVPVIGFF